MAELAISSWSLHRILGPTYPSLDVDDASRAAAYPYGQGSLSLLELPAAVAARGIATLEICHFHFPRTDAVYLQMLRARLAEARVALLTLLIDAGDISASDLEARERDMVRIRSWIEVASAVGARQVRVIAGYGSPEDPAAVRRGSAGLAELARYAAERSVGVITENWQALSMRPETLLAILAEAGPSVGLCADFGNYSGPGKYDQLQQILSRASSIHARAEFPQPGQMDAVDFQRCLDLARGAGFDGPYVLIPDGAGDEWAHVEQMMGKWRLNASISNDSSAGCFDR